MSFARSGCLIAVLLLSLTIPAAVTAAPRPFPDTRTKNRIFTD